jgi:hypothetical protein
MKVEIPAEYDPVEKNRHFLYDAYVGYQWSDLGNAWTIGATLGGEDKELFLTPQVRKGLTRTGALAAAFGVRTRIAGGIDSRRTSLIGYLLWEYLEPVRARR